MGHCASATNDALQGPWSVSSEAPTIVVPHAVEKNHTSSLSEDSNTPAAAFCHLALHFYQNTLSVVFYSACPMEPSCSNYSIEAIHKHGAFPGIVLTFDRLLHEGDETRHAQLIKTQHRGYRFHDPVENNDFWWRTP